VGSGKWGGGEVVKWEKREGRREKGEKSLRQKLTPKSDS
jgi:hypothetical protein